MKNITIWVLRLFIGLVAAMLLYPGITWSFIPETNLLLNNIEVNSVLGMNMMKSAMGTGLLSTSIFMILFLFNGKQWFLPSVILMAVFLLIRIISLLTDGSHQMIIVGILLEILSIIAMWGLSTLQGDKS